MVVAKLSVPEFPEFYFKAVGGRFSLIHRLTHSYITSVETEEELVAELEKVYAMPKEELWNDLLYKRCASIVSQNDFSRRFEQDEQWYFSAWGMYTARFYEKYPKLLNEVLVLPYELINQIRRTKSLEAQAQHEARRKEIEQYQHVEKVEKKKADEIIPIGDTVKAEKVSKMKKIKPKLKFKKKPNEVMSMPIISDNPFD